MYMINITEVYACNSVDSTLLVYGHSDGDVRETIDDVSHCERCSAECICKSTVYVTKVRLPY